jgi:hypothetical protein
MDGLDEGEAVERLGGGWVYGGRCGAASRKDAEVHHNELACTVLEEDGGLGGSAFGDAFFQGAPGERVGEEQVIDYALDAPFIRV